MDWQVIGVFGAVIATILFSFVVVPEILERRGYNPRSARVRAIVWLSFLAIVFLPAAITGFLLSVANPADWLYLIVALTVAILYDYYRLNPSQIPWFRGET